MWNSSSCFRMVEKEGLSSGLVHQHFLINSNLQHTTLLHQLESTTYNTSLSTWIYNIQHFFINSNLQYTTLLYQLKFTTYNTSLSTQIYNIQHFFIKSITYITSSLTRIYNIQHFVINSNLQYTTLLYQLKSSNTTLTHQLESTIYNTPLSTQIYNIQHFLITSILQIPHFFIKSNHNTQYWLINSNLYNIQHFFINSNLQHTALPHHLKSSTYNTSLSTQIYIYIFICTQIYTYKTCYQLESTTYKIFSSTLIYNIQQVRFRQLTKYWVL